MIDSDDVKIEPPEAEGLNMRGVMVVDIGSNLVLRSFGTRYANEIQDQSRRLGLARSMDQQCSLWPITQISEDVRTKRNRGPMIHSGDLSAESKAGVRMWTWTLTQFLSSAAMVKLFSSFKVVQVLRRECV